MLGIFVASYIAIPMIAKCFKMIIVDALREYNSTKDVD